jgi:hypothetical protein
MGAGPPGQADAQPSWSPQRDASLWHSRAGGNSGSVSRLEIGPARDADPLTRIALRSRARPCVKVRPWPSPARSSRATAPVASAATATRARSRSRRGRSSCSETATGSWSASRERARAGLGRVHVCFLPVFRQSPHAVTRLVQTGMGSAKRGLPGRPAALPFPGCMAATLGSMRVSEAATPPCREGCRHGWEAGLPRRTWPVVCVFGIARGCRMVPVRMAQPCGWQPLPDAGGCPAAPNGGASPCLLVVRGVRLPGAWRWGVGLAAGALVGAVVGR